MAADGAPSSKSAPMARNEFCTGSVARKDDYAGTPGADGGIAGKHYIFYRGAFFEMQRPGDFHIITRLGNLTNRPGGLLPVAAAFYFGMGPGPYKNGGIHKVTLSGDVSLVCWFKLRPHGHNDIETSGENSDHLLSREEVLNMIMAQQ